MDKDKEGIFSKKGLRYI